MAKFMDDCGWRIIGFLMAIVIFWLCWNYVMPVFGLPILTYLQSGAILVLFNLLTYKRFGGK